jgi:hypothetical protein
VLRILSFVVCVALTGATAWAQPPAAAGAVAKATHEQFLQVRNLVMRSLDKVPDEMLSFRATPDVRTFAQLFGHIADGQTLLCTAAKGEKPAMTQEYEKGATTKAALAAALRKSNEFCDTVYAGMSEPAASELVPVMGGAKWPRLSVPAANNSHTWEHYGNLVTYLRLNKIVPPSSEGQSRPSGQ